MSRIAGEGDSSETTKWHALTGEFHCVDVGSRGGFRDLLSLHPRLHVYSLDADATAESPPQSFASFHHFPVALYSSEGEMDLVVTERPGFSSLLEFDAAAFDRHFGLMAGSKTWRQGFTPKRRQKTRVLTADAFFDTQCIPRIDFLKLDTQGTELEILKGAHEYLRSGRIAVIKTEVSFLPVYQNQCTFSEIDQFLKAHGFVFVDCAFYPDAVHTPSSAKAIAGLSLKEQTRFTAGGDAVYVLHPDKCANADRASFSLRSAVLVNQLGYVSLAFDLLTRAAYPSDLVEDLLLATAHSDARHQWKQMLKKHLPPWAFRKVLQARRLIQRLRRSAE